MSILAAAKEKAQRSSGENMLSKAYMIAYNVAQTLGWTAIMVVLVRHVMETGSITGVYTEVAPLLNIFQTAAILEVVHCAVGLVRSNVALTAAQVYSRVFLTWAIAYSVESVQSYYGVFMFILAWTITEIIRYSFYLFGLIGNVPYIIQWCRYTFFIVLYPLGVSGEVISVIKSFPEVQRRKLYSVELPNAANMSFNFFYYLIVFLIMYIPVFPQLYCHMLSQRKKIIGKKDTRPKSD